MIEANSFGSFGSKFSVIKTPSFNIRITTAKEGIFSGLSSAVWDDDGGFPPPLCAQVSYPSSMSKSERHAVHDTLTEHLNSRGESGMDLPEALWSILAYLQEEETIKTFSIV